MSGVLLLPLPSTMFDLSQHPHPAPSVVQYLGAALAMSAAALYDVLLLLGYCWWSGRWAAVVGTPSLRSFKGWRSLARLAYPAAFMKCAESW